MPRRPFPPLRSILLVGPCALALNVSPALAADVASIALSAAAAPRATAISAPRIFVSPASHDFGEVLVGESASRTYSVINAGDQNLILTGVTSSDPQFSATTPLPLTLPPAGQQSVSVRFAPSAALPASATLTFLSNGENGPFTTQATGTGTVIAGPLLGAGRIVIAPIGETGGDQFGNGVAGVGDVNGDGYPDLLVTAWTSDGIAGDAGRAYLYHGGAPMDDQADLVLDGEAFRDNFGTSCAGVGDFNGDGFADFIIGAYANDAGGMDAGRAYLYFGGPGMDSDPDRIFTGAGAYDGFGVSVSGAGDVNGDGYHDVIVGAHGNGAGGAAAGRAYVYFGGPAADEIPDWTLTGAAAGDFFGYHVAGGGDVNGDGHADVIVGAPRNDAGGVTAGRVYVFLGGMAPDLTSDLTLTGEAAGDQFGVDVAAAGDVNGDGYADLVVCADLNDAGGNAAGRVYLYHGGAVLDGAPDAIFTGDAAGAGLGVRLAGGGDLNGDGYDDVIAGAWRHPAGGEAAGRCYVFFGGVTTDPSPDLILTGERPGDLFGSTVSGLGDVDGDGSPEFAVGAYYYDEVLGEEGRAYVVGLESTNRPPVVSAPSLVSGSTGAALAFTVTASDPDGDPIASLTASTLPAGATFVPGAGNTSGAFSWTPTSAQAGTHSVVFTATNDLIGSKTTTFQIAGGNAPPVLSAPAAVFGAEGVAITFAVTANDPEGEHVTLGVQARPVGALFIDQGDNSGSFAWTPGFGQAGTYGVTFTGRDESGVDAASRTVSILVDNVNRPPVASPGGPYSGIINTLIPFDGTGSADPDGDPLSYAWSFGDARSATGPTPVHAFASGGVFPVTLIVSDAEASHSASTTATIQDVFAAAASLDAANRTTRLASAKATTCVQIEPVDRAFANTSVDIASIAMVSPGTGSVSRILAMPGKSTIGADRDRDGIDEITACFGKEDLRRLFDGLPGGRQTVGVTIEGSLASGGRFHAMLEMEVVAQGGGLAASASPIPMNPAGVITFRAERPGRVRARLYDIGGRLVRTLLDREFPSGGYHDVPVDGRSDDGRRLGSGVYFYRIETEEGAVSGRIAIVN